MKKHLILIIHLSFLIISFSFGQNIDSLSFDTTMTKLYGIWHIVYTPYYSKYSNDTIVFSRITKRPYGWGSKIEIKMNGEFIDSYSAKCGNDDKIHHRIGKWFYDKERKIFETTIPIDERKTKYKIHILTNDTLIFVKP